MLVRSIRDLAVHVSVRGYLNDGNHVIHRKYKEFLAAPVIISAPVSSSETVMFDLMKRKSNRKCLASCCLWFVVNVIM